MLDINNLFVLSLVGLFLAIMLLGSIVLLLKKKLRKAHEAEIIAQTHVDQLQKIAQRYAGIADIEAATKELQLKQQKNREQFASEKSQFEVLRSHLTAEIAHLQKNLDGLNEEFEPQSFGLYKPQFTYETSEQYKQKLLRIRELQKESIKTGKAAICHTKWAVGDSQAQGQKMIRETIKLLLLAFNGECDALVANVKYNNVLAVQEKLRKLHDQINQLGKTKTCEITKVYLDLKLLELMLAHEYTEKKQQEKQEQLQIKEKIREEREAEREIEKAQKDAEREEMRYQNALAKARNDARLATGQQQARLQAKIEELEQQLSEAQLMKQRALSRASQTRQGTVYIISNIGSLGEHVYKIGMTRRLDPIDRIKELGDASVPFNFDVHALIQSEDAPTFERELHLAFHSQRVNKINERKEFFRVSLLEIEKKVISMGHSVEFMKIARAEEFCKTIALERDLQEKTASREYSVTSSPQAIALVG